MAHWVEQRPEFIAQRYDRLAPFYGALEWLYMLPLLGVRQKTVSALRLRPGDPVLEVGCGSGGNFQLLNRAVGPTGTVLGVDLSAGMLARAKTPIAAETASLPTNSPALGLIDRSPEG